MDSVPAKVLPSGRRVGRSLSRQVHRSAEGSFRVRRARVSRFDEATRTAQSLRAAFTSDVCKKWVVYAKRPFGGAEHALRYLGCYTHRVAISNHRLVSFAEDQVTFRWRDSAYHNKQRLLTLHVHEFLRRFLLHVLPPGFVRIRHFGFLSTRKRSTLLPLCFRLLGTVAVVPETAAASAGNRSQQRVTWLCPHCNGPMLILERWTASQLRFRSPPNLHSTAA